MAKLAAVVDSLDAVPEALKEMYVASSDGKSFVLDADIESHPATSGLRSKNQDLIRREKEANDKLKPFAGLDPAKVTEAIEAQRKADEDRQKQEGNYETLKTQMQTQLATKEKEWGTEKSNLLGVIERRVARDEARAAIVALDGNATLLLPHVLGQIRVVPDGEDYVPEVIDKKGNARIGTTGDPMTIKELVAEMMTKDEYKPAFNAPAVSGSGARQSEKRGQNGDIILTREQGKDPLQYRRAKADAEKRGVQVRIADQ